jgi:RecA-family ATPase
VAEVVQLKPFKTISPIKWHGRQPPPRDWLIDGVLLRKTVCLFSGSGNLGKSMLMQQLISSCAVGKPWLGMQVPPCKSFALFSEDPEDEVWRRQEGISRSLDIDHGDLEDVLIQTLDQIEDPALYRVLGKNETGRPTREWLRLVEQVKDHGAELVIIDNANSVFEANENFKEHVRPFIGLLGKLARDINGGVILVQHPSQSGDIDRSAKAGSRAWFDTARSQMILEYPKEFGPDDEPSDERILRFGKQNYGRKRSAIRIEYYDHVFRPCLLADQQGGDLSLMDRLDMRSKVEKTMREGIKLGNRYSLTDGARNHVASVFRKDKSWQKYTWKQINSECESMVKDGKLVVVNCKRNSTPVTYVRPVDCRYAEEGSE